MTCIYLAEILNNHIPPPIKIKILERWMINHVSKCHHYANNGLFQNSGHLFAGVWSRDKFPAKIFKLTRGYIDL